jgi:hypothetical protein
MAMLNNQMVIIKQTMIKALLTKNNIKGFIIQKNIINIRIEGFIIKKYRISQFHHQHV